VAAQPSAGVQTTPQRGVEPGPQASPQARPQARPQTRPAPQPEASQPPSTAAPPPNNTPSPAATTPPPPAPPSLPFATNMGDLLAYVAGLNLPQGKIDRAAEYIENRFVFDREAITRSTLNANQQRWETDIRDQTGNDDLDPELYRDRFTAVYRQRVCLSDMPGEIRIGALVNPDGTWRSEPALLRSSGYGALDRRALRDIQKHRFEPAAGVQAHILTVETSVDYGERPCLDPDTLS
jgi:TonB family protein